MALSDDYPMTRNNTVTTEITKDNEIQSQEGITWTMRALIYIGIIAVMKRDFN